MKMFKTVYVRADDLHKIKRWDFVTDITDLLGVLVVYSLLGVGFAFVVERGVEAEHDVVFAEPGGMFEIVEVIILIIINTYTAAFDHIKVIELLSVSYYKFFKDFITLNMSYQSRCLDAWNFVA